MEEFDAKPYCEVAMEFAQKFQKYFSYQEKDVDEMEEILGILHQDYQNQELSDETLQKIAVFFGVYLGQIMLDSKLSECGYVWDGEQICLKKDDKNKMYPVSKVYKRIVNGIEDSVKSFYDVAIAIAEGRFPHH
ncbi:MAG: hypothetical protein V3G42_09980 [Oscillospiraceae bacterium]